MDWRKWPHAYTFTCLPEHLQVFADDEVFGTEEPPGWHRSRGKLRRVRIDPRWRWQNYYETMSGFVTDDPEIAARFERLAALVPPKG